jgi:hypothetical protein
MIIMKKSLKQITAGFLAGLLLLSASGFSVLAAEQSAPVPQEIPIETPYFPDPYFAANVEQFDTDGNGALSTEEREAVTYINIRSTPAASLKGVEYFPNLEKLNCINNQITSLDLSGNPKLLSLLCNENQLTSLDTSANPLLQSLHCYDNKLTALDFSNNPALQELACGDSMLDQLDVSHCPNLKYLTFLKGTLDQIDLTHNPELEELLISYSLITELDLSQNPKLTYLSVSHNQLTYLDVSRQTMLESFYAEDNRLLALKGNDALPSYTYLSGQRPYPILLPFGETEISFSALPAEIQADQISNLQNGQLGTQSFQQITPDTTMQYQYGSGISAVTCSIAPTWENGWVTPLTLDDWVYGEIPNTPEAEALHGEVSFSYSNEPDGTFLPEQPTLAGTWYVKATVSPSDGHKGLEDVKEFHILKAEPSYQIPQGLTATYGDRLSAVTLPTGFAWENPQAWVGDAGVHTIFVDYTPTDQQNYLTVDHLSVELTVLPYDGTQLPIPDITSQEEADTLTISHEDYPLVKDKDYTLSQTTENGMVTLTITFQGNYTGVVTRSFSAPTSGGSGGSGGSTCKDYADVSADAWYAPSVCFVTNKGWMTGVDDDHFAPQETLTRAMTVTILHRVDGTSAAIASRSFTDVPENTWYSQAVLWAEQEGIVLGYGDNSFRPDAPVTRDHLVRILYRYAAYKGLPLSADKENLSPFADSTSLSPESRDAWSWAIANGLIQGRNSTTLAPAGTATRAETAAIFHRLSALLSE